MSKEKTVTIELPQETAKVYAEWDCCTGIEVRVTNKVKEACKKAMRPPAPTLDELTWLIGGYPHNTENGKAFRRISDWVLYVKENGWVPENE